MRSRLARANACHQIPRMAKLKNAVHFFLVGLGSVLTVQAGPKPSYLTRPIKDSLARDWHAVGADLSLGLQKYPESHAMNYATHADY